MTTNSSRDALKSKAEHEYLYQKDALIANRFKVIEPLGFGGFSEVYHCSNEIGKEYAIKVLLGGEGLTEAKAIARFKHPHIVEAYEVVKDASERSVIIFQYIEGQTLETILAKASNRRLPLDTACLQIIYQIAQAIDYAHSQDVVHRDIKPSNIVIDNRGNAYLTDFGLAEVKMPEEPQSMLSADMQKRFSGTLPYMSPEQIVEGLQGDARSDLYSFGVVVYEMLTGRFPYPGRETQLVFQIGAGEPQPPTAANAALPKSIDEVLLQALSKDPQKRPESCLAFVQALSAASQAYVEAEKKYPTAQKFFDEGDWRKALFAFQALQRATPDFKDVNAKVEKARQQVYMLELREHAQKQTKEGDYFGAFSTLDALHQIDAEYDVADVLQSLLDDLYRQAVQQYQAKEYEASERTLDTIRGHRADYPDPQNIETLSREEAAKQRHQRDLYNNGVAQMEAEEWQQAVVTFEALKVEVSRYKDSEVRLATARHFAVLSTGLAKALRLFREEQFAASVDNLKEVQRLNETYKQEEVAHLRQEALTSLHEHAQRSLNNRQFEECLKALDELEQRTQEYTDVEDLRQQAREGIRLRALLAELNAQYQKANNLIRQRQYASALNQWQEVQSKKGHLEFQDSLDIESRAKDGLCTELYERAVAALGQNKPEEARDYWKRIQEIDANFPDRQHLVQGAKELQQKIADEQRRKEEEECLRREKENADRAKRRKLARLALMIGSGLVGLILVAVVISNLPILVPPPSTPTATPTQPASPTATPSPVPTTAVPASTPTQVPVDTPVPATPTPPNVGNIATALQPSTIYVSPGVNSAELAYVQRGEQVAILGRSDNGNWFYVQDSHGTKGYVSKDRFQWTGDFAQLPVMTSSSKGGTITPGSTPIPFKSPTPTSSGEGLTLDLWPLPWTAKCLKDGTWTMSIFMSGHGASGVYTYYWNNEKKGGPMSTDFTFIITATSSQQGTGRVVSSDGLQLDKYLKVNRPACP